MRDIRDGSPLRSRVAWGEGVAPRRGNDKGGAGELQLQGRIRELEQENEEMRREVVAIQMEAAERQWEAGWVSGSHDPVSIHATPEAVNAHAVEV